MSEIPLKGGSLARMMETELFPESITEIDAKCEEAKKLIAEGANIRLRYHFRRRRGGNGKWTAIDHPAQLCDDNIQLAVLLKQRRFEHTIVMVPQHQACEYTKFEIIPTAIKTPKISVPIDPPLSPQSAQEDFIAASTLRHAAPLSSHSPPPGGADLGGRLRQKQPRSRRSIGFLAPPLVVAKAFRAGSGSGSGGGAASLWAKGFSARPYRSGVGAERLDKSARTGRDVTTQITEDATQSSEVRSDMQHAFRRLQRKIGKKDAGSFDRSSPRPHHLAAKATRKRRNQPSEDSPTLPTQPLWNDTTRDPWSEQQRAQQSAGADHLGRQDAAEAEPFRAPGRATGYGASRLRRTQDERAAALASRKRQRDFDRL